MNVYVRVAGTIVACLLLLAVAVRASTVVTGERDRQTWDSLLTTTLGSTDILFGKWLGSMLAVRWGWVWLALIWALGLVTTGLHVLAFPLLLVAWVVYAAFLATLGLWYSTICQTSLRATVWTLMTALAAYGGHWLLWMCCIPIFMMGSGPSSHLDWIPQFQAFALTPPVGLGWLAFHGKEFDSSRANDDFWRFTFYALFGLMIWGGVTAALWAATHTRFRELTGRMPFLPRHRPAPASRSRPIAAKHPADFEARSPSSSDRGWNGKGPADSNPGDGLDVIPADSDDESPQKPVS